VWSHIATPARARTANESSRLLDQSAGQTGIGNRPDRFSRVAVKIQRIPICVGPHLDRSGLMCFSVGRLARTYSIATGTKEEQQIMVMTEFRVER
jgi:hypothetical protein